MYQVVFVVFGIFEDRLPPIRIYCFLSGFVQLRTVCYNLLGLACRQGALYLAIPADKVQEIVVDRLLAGLDYVENRLVVYIGLMKTRFKELLPMPNKITVD